MVGKNKVSSRREEIFILIVRLEKISEKVDAELVSEDDFLSKKCLCFLIKQGGRGSGRSSVTGTINTEVTEWDWFQPPPHCRSGPNMSKQCNYSVSTVEQRSLQFL